MSKQLRKDLEIVEKVDLHDLKERLGLKHTQSLEFLKLALANALLFDRKHDDYGPKNIAVYGAYGCQVRASDKFARLAHLYKNRRRRATNESIYDSYRDISNYSIIALLCEEGKWMDT